MAATSRASWERLQRRAGVTASVGLVPTFEDEKELWLASKFGVIMHRLKHGAQDDIVREAEVSFRTLLQRFEGGEAMYGVARTLCAFMFQAMASWCSSDLQSDERMPLGIWNNWQVPPGTKPRSS